jgi:WD40 repeat protein
MTTNSASRLAWFACILSVVATPVRANDPASAKPIRVDAFGDRLPGGAVARLGTLRLVHRGSVTAVAVSPDGKLVASGVYGTRDVTRFGVAEVKEDVRADQRGVRLWATRTGKLIREVLTPAGHTSCLLFSADGAELYGACGKYLCCWNPHTGENRWRRDTTEDGKSQTWLQETSLVLAGNRLVSIHSGHLHIEIRGTNWSTSTGHSQIAVRIWNRKTGVAEPLPAALESGKWTGKDIPAVFHSAAISADGRVAAVITSYGKPPEWMFKGGKGFEGLGKWEYLNPRLRIVDVGTGAIRHDFPATHIDTTKMTLSDDGSRLAIAAGPELSVLNLGTGRKTAVAEVSKIQELRFVQSAEHLAARLEDQSIRVWDWKTGRRLDQHAVRDNHFRARQGDSIVAVGNENTVRLLSRDTGKPLLDFDGHRQAPWVRFAPAPEHTLNSVDSEQAYRWETGTWKMRERVAVRSSAASLRFYRRSGAVGPTISPDNGLRLEETQEGLTLHDWKTGKLVRTLDDSAGTRHISFFSANGARVISIGEKRTVFFDVGTGKRLAAVENLAQDRLLAAFMGGSWCAPVVSPTGRLIAGSLKCVDVSLFQVDTGKLLRNLLVKDGAGTDSRFAILRLWFSPDERFILAELHRALEGGGESVDIAVWDTDSGTAVQEVTIIPHMPVWHRASLQIHAVGALAMSPDRRFIALARTDHNYIELWDTASASRRGVLNGHEGAVTDLAFSPDGRFLASGSDDTTILVWDLNRPLHAADFDGKKAEPDFAACWRALTDPDAARADTAIWRLVKAGAPAVAFLKERLKPRPRPDPVRLRRLVDNLGSDDFKTRAQAQAELEGLRDTALTELKDALARKGSLEQQRRLQLLLPRAERSALPFGTPELWREWRALEVLERIGSREAVELLESLATGAPAAPLTVHAAEILTRLSSVKK